MNLARDLSRYDGDHLTLVGIIAVCGLFLACYVGISAFRDTGKR